ncbi:MAG: type IV pilus modification protein PilV [Xenophilus sp.]
MTGLPRQVRGQRGITLLESLAALLVLAVAVLGMLGAQVRTLAETQTGVRRAQAVRLIEDLAERIKSNPGGFGQLVSYVADWDTVPPAADCSALDCSPDQLARWDVRQWKLNVAQTLPSGEAHVFESADETAENRRQLGVMVGWQAGAGGTASLQPTGAAAGAACREGRLCHLVYVQP